MLKNLKQQSGFSLVGILVVVVIIAALAYGSLFFWSKSEHTKGTKSGFESTVDVYNQAQQDLSDISQKINKKNELINKTLDEREPDTSNWRTYVKKEKNVRLKYHKDWYYDRDEQAEKDLGYDLYVGFAESPEILDQGRFYPIEFIIVDKDYEFPQYYSGYVKVIAVKDGKQYVLKTEDSFGYIDIIDKMTESFEFIDEITDSRQQTTEDWKTYRDKENDFEFRYPSIFQIKDDREDFIDFYYSNEMKFNISIVLKRFDLQNIQTIYGKVDPDKVEIKNINEDNKAYIYKLVDAGWIFWTIDIPRGNKTITLNFNYCPTCENEIEMDKFKDSIITTFKFIGN